MSKPELKVIEDVYTRPADFYPPHVIRNLSDGNKAQGYMYDKEVVNLIYGGEKDGAWKYADRDHPCYMDTAHPIWIKLL